MKGFWIPAELLELKISWTKRILLAEISSLEMLDKGCIASNSHFANKLKLTNQAISKALNELDSDGLIVINNAQTKRNFGRTITINFSVSDINSSKSAINYGKSAIHESGESKENNSNKNSSSNTISISEQIESDFNFFWSNYPKKKDKEKAKKSFIKHYKELPEINDLVRIVVMNANTNDWKKEKGQYIPMPSTWLNGKRWQDDVTVEKTIDVNSLIADGHYDPFNPEHHALKEKYENQTHTQGYINE